jgi:uncharacterized protein (TIGR02271 family)
VRAEDPEAERAVGIMERHNPVDVERRATDWREGGWTGYSTDAEPYTADQIAEERGRYGASRGAVSTPRVDRAADGDRDYSDRGGSVGAGDTLEVVEEDLQVGKRQTQEGGVRAETHVTETPVEKDVRLREEEVHVDRHPVDRPAGDAFKEGSVEVRTVSEEPVVEKRARVIEEVVLSKDANERTETVRDTVRRTDVDIEELNADSRRHYDSTFETTDYDYDQYRPAYGYGHDLAGHESYRGRDWDEVEPDARREWEARNPGTWDEFKDAVRQGWNRVRG